MINNSLYEYSDLLNSPFEIFEFDTSRVKPFPVLSHWHYYLEFLFAKKGPIRVTVADQKYDLKEGDFIVIPPQTIHSIEYIGKVPDKDESQPVFLGLKINPARIYINGEYIPRPDHYFMNLVKNRSVDLHFESKQAEELGTRVFFDELLKEYALKSYGYDSIIYSLVGRFVTLLIREFKNRGVEPGNIDRNSSTQYSITDILTYIDEHSGEKLQIVDLAARCNMSYSYFAKSFREIYGQSCKDYIEKVRINKAEHLLRFTDMDISRISQETGFSDSSHLIRFFKKTYGITPKQFRSNSNKL